MFHASNISPRTLRDLGVSDSNDAAEFLNIPSSINVGGAVYEVHQIKGEFYAKYGADVIHLGRNPREIRSNLESIKEMADSLESQARKEGREKVLVFFPVHTNTH